MDGVLRRARAKLRVCRLVDPKRFRESGTSRRRRSDGRGGRGGRVGGADGGRVGGADAAFTFALTPGEPNSPRREPNASRSRPSRITASNDDDDDDLLAIRSTARDVFAAVEGAENLSRFLSDEANPALFRHGVALTLAAFFPPADDPFGGFRLGVVVHRPDDAPSTPALSPSTPQTAFDIRSPRARLRFGGDSDDDENQPGAEPDEGNDASGYGASPSDAERGDGDSPCESPGGDAPGGESSVVGSLEEKAFRGAAAWAVAAATRGRAGVSGVSGRGARDDEHGGERFTSLRSLASPMTERAGPGPGSTTRLDSTRVVSRANASPRTSKMAWPPPLDASDSLDGARARARARVRVREPESASPASTPRSAAANRAREDERRRRAKTRARYSRAYPSERSSSTIRRGRATRRDPRPGRLVVSPRRSRARSRFGTYRRQAGAAARARVSPRSPSRSSSATCSRRSPCSRRRSPATPRERSRRYSRRRSPCPPPQSPAQSPRSSPSEPSALKANVPRRTFPVPRSPFPAAFLVATRNSSPTPPTPREGTRALDARVPHGRGGGGGGGRVREDGSRAAVYGSGCGRRLRRGRRVVVRRARGGGGGETPRVARRVRPSGESRRGGGGGETVGRRNDVTARRGTRRFATREERRNARVFLFIYIL